MIKVEKAKAILTLHKIQHKKRRKRTKERHSFADVRHRLEKTKEQSKYTQYKVEKLRRKRIRGRSEKCPQARNK